MTDLIVSRKGNHKHGLTVGGIRNAGPEYRAWMHIKDRCFNPRSKSWKRYGGRGITVCDRWVYGENGLHPLLCFIADMGFRPDGLSIDRIEVNGNYEPENCRWADGKTQMRNMTTNRIVLYSGMKIPLSQAAELAGLPYKTVHVRIKRGWSHEKALSVPLFDRGQKANCSNT